MSEQQQYKSPDKFDRMHGSLSGRPDVTRVKASTKNLYTPLIGATQTYTVETMRAHDEHDGGDTVFIIYVDDQGATRLYLPPAVSDMIARQRDALTTKTRKRVGKASAEARKARGELPGFMKGKKKTKPKE